MFHKLFYGFNERRYTRLTERRNRLQELVDGIDEEVWPDEYALARQDLASVSIQQVNLAARLRKEV